MNCAPDFVDLLWLTGSFVFSAVVLYGFCEVDKTWAECEKKWLWFLWGFTALLINVGLYEQFMHGGWVVKLSILLLAVYLIVSVVMDSMLCLVNDAVQYIGLTGGVIYILFKNPLPQMGVWLILFVVMQRVFFLRYYGAADGMSFIICALYLAGTGKEIDSYLLHMTISYILLAVVQGVFGNISRKGHLVEPVGMLPYIAMGFFLLML